MKYQITIAYNNLRDCVIREAELGEKLIQLTIEQRAAHKQTLLAKEEIENLK